MSKNTSPHKTPSSRDKASEIEIASAMIEAGVAVYCNRNFQYEDEFDLVADIYRAMALRALELGLL